MTPACYTRKIKLSQSSLLSQDCLENGLWGPGEWIKDAEWKAEQLLTFHKTNKYFQTFTSTNQSSIKDGLLENH